MCNNYALSITPTDLADVFQDHIEDYIGWAATTNLQPTDDIRPTDLAPVLVATGGGVTLTRLSWGLRDAANPKRPPVINYRSEGRAFERGRCLVPASSFFEFTGETSPKTRWRFSRTDGDWFCFAGFMAGPGEDARFTLLTTAPGPDIAPIHDRQPVVLNRSGWAGWMSGAPAAGLLAPSPAGTWTVSQAPREVVGTLL